MANVNSHENCYKMIGDLREDLNEFSTALQQGTDTSGNYLNTYLLKKLNEAQEHMTAQMFLHKPEIFLKRTTIVGVDSVYTLPYNFGKLIEFRDSEGNRVYPTTVQAYPKPADTGNENLYFRENNTLVLLKSGYTETHTLYYYFVPRELTFGQAGASSGALALHLTAANTDLHDDYYNGVTVDDYTAAFTSVISDYTASTQVAVVTGTAAASDWYGTVSELPEPFHKLIVPLAELLISSQHPAAQRKPSAEDWKRWEGRFFQVMWAFATPGEDQSIFDIFADYDATPPVGGINIPGQGYTIF